MRAKCFLCFLFQKGDQIIWIPYGPQGPLAFIIPWIGIEGKVFLKEYWQQQYKSGNRKRKWNDSRIILK